MSLFPDIDDLPFLASFLGAVQSGVPEVVVSGLRGGAKPLALAAALSEIDGPSLILVKNSAAARALIRDLTFFLGGSDAEAVSRIFLYPALDISPFESISPHIEITGRRMSCLSAMLNLRQRAIVVAPVEAVMEKVVSREMFSRRVLETYVDDLLERDEFAQELSNSGYSRVPLTEEVGDFSVRGGIIDVFCPQYDRPIRIELDDIEVKSIRFFDPSSQITKAHTKRIRIGPARQIVFDEETRENFAEKIKTLADELGAPKQDRDRQVEQIDQGIFFPGIEFFLPLFYENLGTVLDYLSEESPVFIMEPGEIEHARDMFEERIWRRRARAADAGKLACEPESMYLSSAAFEQALTDKNQVRLGLDAFGKTASPRNFHVEIEAHEGLREQILQHAKDEDALGPLVKKIRAVLRADGRCILVCSSTSGVDRMERMLAPYSFKVKFDEGATFTDLVATPSTANIVSVLLGELSTGFAFPANRLCVICEEEIFGEKQRQESVARFKGDVISSFSDLSEDEFVVHVVHGVGIFRGLVQLDVGEIPGEFLLLEYARGDKLYLPVYRLSQVQRFVGAGATPVVDRLGGLAWEKIKKKAKAAAKKIAKELLALYAKRAARPGYAFDPPDSSFSAFESTFPFVETPDQISAIADVVEGMTKPHPMERLVCGDVGFGKTEIALRGTYLAVLSGKQVAVLVPTTTLAFQHARTFKKRLSPFGVNVEMLSRFTDTKQVKEIFKKMENGGVDVVIGTHRLLSQKVKFKDLGLLIVDEEQHFGVVQKEKLKKLKENVDVLTMTATPIPRTLNMALSGIRDLSVINTPPEDRLAVRTYISTWDEDTLSEAIDRELRRDGQIFFVHNRIRSIDQVAQAVQRLAPNAKIQIAHGQMDAKRIEKILIDFAEHKFDILVSTAIIESGLDFPRANTIFIHRADILGLSQLYQLRGRVGRAKRRAYCYLIIPGDKNITKDARKRLAVLRTFTDLGSGYKIAARDMEIRGAGNLLGDKQSGHINAVGFELFTELLDQAVKSLRGEEVTEKIDPEIALRIPAYLPEEYVADVGQRLALYKRLSDAEDLSLTEEIHNELIDRYGSPPPSVLNLIKVMEIKVLARRLRIKAIEGGPDGVTYSFDDSTPVRPSTLVTMASQERDRFVLLPDGKLVEKVEMTGESELFITMKKTLQRLE